jgi:hypothetical protein
MLYGRERARYKSEWKSELHPRGQPANKGEFVKANGKSGSGVAVKDKPAPARKSRTDTPEFRRWFGKSKVVDAQGKPMVVYHGTKRGDWSTMDPDVGDLGLHVGTEAQAEQFVGPDASAAGDEHIMPLYARIENPLRLRDAGFWRFRDVAGQLEKLGIKIPPGLSDKAEHIEFNDQDNFHKWSNQTLQSLIRGAGYDGVVYTNRGEGKIDFDALHRDPIWARFLDRDVPDEIYRKYGAEDSWIAFDPNQVKSTLNQGTFSTKDNRVEYEQERTRYKSEWKSELHPRGQPKNKGQFVVRGTGSTTATKEKPKEKPQAQPKESTKGAPWPEKLEKRDKPGTYKSKAKIKSVDDEEVRDWLENNNLDIPIDDLPTLLGIPDDATVDISANYDEIGISAVSTATYQTPKGATRSVWTMDREIQHDDDGDLFIHNAGFFINDRSAQGKGLGHTVLAHEVEEAWNAGIGKITTTAARSAFMIGYKVWPKLGFDGELPDWVHYKSDFPGNDDTIMISQLYKTPGGREWWEEHGSNIDLEFDTRPDSESRKTLNEYIKQWNKEHGVRRDAPGQMLMPGFERNRRNPWRAKLLRYARAWQSELHPRGQPENKGEFIEKGKGGATATAEPPATAKPAGKYKSKGRIVSGDKGRIEDKLKQLKLPITAADLPTLIGAPDDATVQLSEGLFGAIVIEAHSPTDYRGAPSWKMKRTLDSQYAGTLILHNDEFFIEDPDLKRKGMGHTVFAHEVEEAMKLGIEEIETVAARDDDPNHPMVGYKVWPKMGYDDTFSSWDIKRLPDDLKGAKRVSDLMATQEGRDWWEINGDSREMTFDMKPGSLSLKTLDAYLLHKEGVTNPAIHAAAYPTEASTSRYGRGIGSTVTRSRTSRPRTKKSSIASGTRSSTVKRSVYARLARLVRYEARHAPKGGVQVAGRFFPGGEFIPSEVMAQATPEERAAVERGGQQAAQPPASRHAGKAPTKALSEAGQARAQRMQAERDYRKLGTRSPEFTNWFGDWVHNPVDASKVVHPKTGEPKDTYNVEASVVRDENTGKPILAYHGSQALFEAFDPKIDSGVNLYGPGFYHTEDKGIAAGDWEQVPVWSEFGTEEEARAATKTLWPPYQDSQTGKWMGSTGLEKRLKQRGYTQKGIKLAPADKDKLGEALSSALARLSRGYLSDTEREHAQKMIDAFRDPKGSHWSYDLIDETLSAQPYNINVPEVARQAGIKVEGHLYASYLNIRRPFRVDGTIDIDPLRALVEPLARGKGLTEFRAAAGKSYFSGHETDEREIRKGAQTALNQLRQAARTRGAPNGDDVYFALEQIAGKQGANYLIKQAGYDGITHIGGANMGTRSHRVWIAFDPGQVKAVDNIGTFDSGNPRMRYARSSIWARLHRVIYGDVQRVRYEAKHAPKGGVEIGGKFYPGGEFITSEVMAQATPEERAKIEAEGTAEAKAKPAKKAKKAAGGKLKYAEAVRKNLEHMGTREDEWKAVEITGMTETEDDRGQPRMMPTFNMPEGYSEAPTLYKHEGGGSEGGTCGLCGTSIKNVYHLQNDDKKWTLPVGSECVTHFQAEGKSGERVAKETVWAENRQFVRDAQAVLARFKEGMPNYPDPKQADLKKQFEKIVSKIDPDPVKRWSVNGKYEDVSTSDAVISRWTKTKGDTVRDMMKQMTDMMGTKAWIANHKEKLEFAIRKGKVDIKAGYRIHGGGTRPYIREELSPRDIETIERNIKSWESKIKELDESKPSEGEGKERYMRSNVYARLARVLLPRQERVRYAWDAEKHPRGQPENKGEFARVKGNGAAASKPRAPQPEAEGFVSPEVESGLDYREARKRAKGEVQHKWIKLSSDIDRKLGLRGTTVTVIGDWAPAGETAGAEPSSITRYENVTDFDTLKYALAIKGRIAKQWAVIPFLSSPGGKDSLWTLDLPADPESVRKSLDRQGIAFRTLQETDQGTRVYLFDQGSELGDKVHAVAKQYHIQPEVRRGHGEFFPTGASTREEAYRKYEAFIAEYERSHPNAPRWVPPGEGRDQGGRSVWDYDWKARYARRQAEAQALVRHGRAVPETVWDKLRRVLHGRAHRPVVRYAVHHAPAGGVSIGGKRFTGGEFIPAEALERATPAERAQVEQGPGTGTREETRSAFGKTRAYFRGISEAPLPTHVTADDRQAAAATKPIKPATDMRDLDRYVRDVEATPLYQQLKVKLDQIEKAAPGGLGSSWSVFQHTQPGTDVAKVINSPDWRNAYRKLKWTNDRKKEHKRILQLTLNPDAKARPGQKPIVVFMMGRPGSGKTTVGVPLAHKLGVGFTTISSDDIRARFPEYEGWNGDVLHSESIMLTYGPIMKRAIKNRHNIIMDIAGSDPNAMMKQAKAFAKAGYELHMINVNFPVYKNASRAWNRFAANAFGYSDPQELHQELGRFVPPGLIALMNGGPEKSYQALKASGLVDCYTMLDNDVPFGTAPKVMDKGGRGGCP